MHIIEVKSVDAPLAWCLKNFGKEFTNPQYWCLGGFGEDKTSIQFKFKKQADATLFALRWS